jgi:hypothetical protein
MQELAYKEERQLRIDYMQTFGTEAAARVLADLQKRCFKRHTTFVPGEPDTSANNEGKRQMLLHIETMMSPEGIKALDEAGGKG